MSAEIQYTGNGGANVYAIVTNPADGTVRDVVAGAWDTYADADIGDYDVVLTRKGTSSQHYQADLPAGLSTTALYKVDIFQRVGGSPAITDPLIGSGTIGPVAADAVLISGDATAADNLESILDGTGAELYLKSTNLANNALKIEHTDQNGIPILVAGSDGAWINVTAADPTGTALALAGSLMSANITQISNDATAANNLEAMLDGTGAAITLTGIDLETVLSAILVDTGTTLDAAIAVVDGNVDAILVDTGTTLPATLATIAGDVAALGSGAITVTSPVATDSTVSVYQGDDYDADEGRSLDFSNAGGDWGGGDITGATVSFTASDKRGEVADVTATGSVVTATGTQVIRVELTAAKTAALTAAGRRWDYQVRLTLSGGRIETVVDADLISIASLFS